MVFLQKTLVLLCMPLSVICLLLFWGIIWKKRAPVIAAFLILIISSLPITESLLTRYVEAEQIQLTPSDVAKADAVVVLGGFLSSVQSTQGEVLQWGMGSRFFGAVDLIKAGKANYLIFTNENIPWLRKANDTGVFLKEYAKNFGIDEKRILITNNVQTTQEEALAVKNLLQEKQVNSVLLVTSAFHMQRAQSQFERAGLQVTAYPVDFKGGGGAKTLLDFNLWSFIPNVGSLGAVTIALTELMARAYYFCQNYLLDFKK